MKEEVEKINAALVIVTYSRQDMLKQVIQSVDPDAFDEIVIIHDGGAKDYDPEVIEVLTEKFNYIKMDRNRGVGYCKTFGIDWVLEQTEADHIFVIEDDMLILDNRVWDYYIEFSSRSGIHHTNWNDYRYHNIKFEVDYNGMRGIVTRDTEGAFSYFHRNIMKFCEFPPDMKNAFEHISVELQLIEKSLLPPFWNFICPKGTAEYVRHIGEESTITGKQNYTINYQNAAAAFERRHRVKIQDIPTSTEEEVLKVVAFLKENYAQIKDEEDIEDE